MRSQYKRLDRISKKGAIPHVVLLQDESGEYFLDGAPVDATDLEQIEAAAKRGRIALIKMIPAIPQ